MSVKHVAMDISGSLTNSVLIGAKRKSYMYTEG